MLLYDNQLFFDKIELVYQLQMLLTNCLYYRGAASNSYSIMVKGNCAMVIDDVVIVFVNCNASYIIYNGECLECTMYTVLEPNCIEISVTLDSLQVYRIWTLTNVQILGNVYYVIDSESIGRLADVKVPNVRIDMSKLKLY